jgi:glycosyltransferase involved in cell wall biosynthesis
VVLCGDGEARAGLEEEARGSRAVVFPGWVDAVQIWTLMEISLAGLAPYRVTENFLLNLPNKPIEYLSAGLPVLTTLEGELGRLLRDGECGTRYAEGSPESLADVLARLLDDRAGREAQGRAARRLFAERFEAARVYGDYAAHLETLARSRRPA